MKILLLVLPLLFFSANAMADSHPTSKPITLNASERLKCYLRWPFISFIQTSENPKKPNMEVSETGEPTVVQYVNILRYGGDLSAANRWAYKRFKEEMVHMKDYPNPLIAATDLGTLGVLEFGYVKEEWQKPPGFNSHSPYVRKKLARYGDPSMWAEQKLLFENSLNEVFMVDLAPGSISITYCLKD